MSSKKFGPSLFGGCLAIAMVGLLGGCSTVQDDGTTAVINEEVSDPIEPFNRYIFDVNSALDAVALKPIAHIYRDAFPDALQDSVRNFLDNLSQPFNFMNNVAQGDFDGAGDNMGSFFTNTFLGVGGLFDVAQIDWDDEDLGQTFAVWGIAEGPYLVLPVLGPNTTREGVGLVGEYFIDPVNLIADNQDIDNVRLIRAGANAIDFRARSIEPLDEIEKNSIDFYATIRSLYRQNRKNLILDGDDGATPLPDISFDLDDDAPLSSDRISLLFEEDESPVAKHGTVAN